MSFPKGDSRTGCIGNASTARSMTLQACPTRMPSVPIDSDLPHRASCQGESPPRDLPEIVSGILALAATEDACVPVAKIHSTLHEMKPREPILAGLHFSLTGNVCYSHDVDRAIRNLTDWGSLEIIDASAVVVPGVRRFRSHLSRSLTKPLFQAVRSVSLRFHSHFRSDATAVRQEPPGRDGNPGRRAG